jgi:alpha/beta superfamily hydrolase
MEEKITFTSDDIAIEGLLHRISKKGVVVTHPHPLYGGNMYNPVVASVIRAFEINGFSTLRFNFRGVGHSQGSHDYGTGERRDVVNALSFLAKQGITACALAGYSFGAWVNANMSYAEAAPVDTIMVSPPVAFVDFSSIKYMPALKLVVAGGRDEIGPSKTIEKLLPDWNSNARLEIIQDADHFYTGCLDDLTTVIDTYIRST